MFYGRAGGSGGGGYGETGGVAYTGGTGTANQGFAGGKFVIPSHELLLLQAVVAVLVLQVATALARCRLLVVLAVMVWAAAVLSSLTQA
jgi:hypothetical protein